MTSKTMKLLVKTGKELDIDITEYPNYSGRGMYGKKTCGVVCSKSDFTTIIASVDLTGEEKKEFVREVKNICSDNMGLDMIYY